MTALRETRIDWVSTPTPLPLKGVDTERETSMGRRILATDTEHSVRPGPSVYTTRKSEELFDFITGHLDAEEREWFFEDLGKAVVQAWQEHSFEPLGRLLAGWEETVEIKLNPELSQALDEAFDEADVARKAQGC